MRGMPNKRQPLLSKENIMEQLFRLYKTNSLSGNEVEIRSLIKEMLADVDLEIQTDFIGNMYITKGKADNYPCVAAHMDEVHEPCQRSIIETDGLVYAINEKGEQVGLGADDKNGIWIAIRLLHELPILKAVFFVEEEKKGDLSGCRGAHVADLSFFNNCRYILESDRKGANDLIIQGKDTPLCPIDFVPQHILDKYHYQPTNGGKTDVVELKMRGLGIAVCNISCGYYNAHHSNEYTKLDELHNSLHFVKELIQTL